MKEDLIKQEEKLLVLNTMKRVQAQRDHAVLAAEESQIRMEELEVALRDNHAVKEREGRIKELQRVHASLLGDLDRERGRVEVSVSMWRQGGREMGGGG